MHRHLVFAVVDGTRIAVAARGPKYARAITLVYLSHVKAVPFAGELRWRGSGVTTMSPVTAGSLVGREETELGEERKRSRAKGSTGTGGHTIKCVLCNGT